MNIDRINELAKKSKNGGLTEEEKIEQKVLREAYLVQFRKNFQQQLNNVYIVDEKGVETKISKKNDESSKKMN